jgi:hypothetical protein
MGRNFKSQFIAVLLLLAFSQKLGLRMWLHGCLHEKNTLQNASAPDAAHFQVKCDCMEDALMPLTHTAVYQLPVEYKNVAVCYYSYSVTVPHVFKTFYSLKGPPVATLLS